MYAVYTAMIICRCQQKRAGDPVITVTAPEKAIYSTEDSVRHKTMTAHVSSPVGNILLNCLKIRQFQLDTFCMKNKVVCDNCRFLSWSL